MTEKIWTTIYTYIYEYDKKIELFWIIQKLDFIYIYKNIYALYIYMQKNINVYIYTNVYVNLYKYICHMYTEIYNLYISRN